MTTLTVDQSADGATITFTFQDGAPQVLAVAMVDEDAEEPVWFFTSDAFTEMLPYTHASVDPEPLPSPEEAAVEKELLARGVDPASLEAGRKANRQLQSFQYGKVPLGFRQVMPTGATLPLQRGRRYCVTVLGGIGEPVGHVSFTA